MKQERVLIVDDDTDVVELLVDILEDAGYEALTAASGREALDKLQLENREPHLVLLDIIMPETDGFQILHLIRQRSSVPVIMLTGRREVDYLRDAIDFGADDYIRKPFRTQELLARIRAKLRRSSKA